MVVVVLVALALVVVCTVVVVCAVVVVWAPVASLVVWALAACRHHNERL